MRWTPMLVLAVVASVAPAWAAEDPKPDDSAVTTTTLPRRRGLVGDARGIPTGLPDFGTPSVPMDGQNPSHEPAAKPNAE